jgi:hypothetical protein
VVLCVSVAVVNVVVSGIRHALHLIGHESATTGTDKHSA